MSLDIDLSGRRAIVSGVTSGIGRAIAEMLARAGCDVAGAGLESADSDGARHFADFASRAGRCSHYACVDLADAAAAERWIGDAGRALGGADIVVSNAGRNFFAGASGCSDGLWNECIDLDLAAHWRVARAARPMLQEGTDPVIVIVVSNHAYATIPGCFPYNVAKAGLNALVQSLAIEWGPVIRAVGIAPGFIDTPGNELWFQSFPDAAAERRRTERRHPVGRIGTAEEIGGICAFLASPWARFVSGTTWLVDGGRSALLQDD